MNFPILLFSFECGASNAPNLNIVAFFISVLQLFPYKKKNIYIYRYLSIEYFLRFFVSYLTRNNLKRLISCINITSIIFSFPPPITIRSNDSKRFQTKMCEQLWCQVNETTCMSNGAQSADGTKCGEKKVRLSPSIDLLTICTLAFPFLPLFISKNHHRGTL